MSEASHGYSFFYGNMKWIDYSSLTVLLGILIRWDGFTIGLI